MIFLAVSAIADVLEIAILMPLAGGVSINQAFRQIDYGLVDVLDWILIAAFIGAAICFLTWVYQTTKALPSLGAGVPSTGPVAAVGWWFVPLANLVKPFLIVRELWERLHPPGAAVGSGSVLAWWLTFVGSGFLLRFIEVFVDDLATLMRLLLLGLALDAVAALLAIRLLVVLERRKGERWRRATVPWAASPPVAT